MSSSTIVGFFIPVSSLKVFDHSIHSERRRIYLGKSIQALQNDTITSWVFSFRVIQPTVRWHTFKTFYVCFHQFLFIIKTLWDSRLLKYLINKELMPFRNKIQAKTFKWPDMSFYARKLTWCAKQIYILTFSDVLLVLALNLIVHKSSNCKCSLAWCQARTFLSFTIWTHPLQMREYPLQYASTDKNKKSHYNNLNY